MTSSGDAALSALEGRIGYVFSDRNLLRTALTHASVQGANYQRLEFLGDRVLALGVSDMMYAAFPNATEGELSRRLAELVRKETCADVAVSLDMGSAVRVGGGKQGTKSTLNILGDVCEAVIAALYLDGGMEVARRFIETNWRARMLAGEGPRRDAKTALQEWAQGRGLATPTYAIVGRSGPDHALRFEVEVRVESLPPYRGEGRTRREAEQDAAATVLLSLGVWKAAGDGT